MFQILLRFPRRHPSADHRALLFAFDRARDALLSCILDRIRETRLDFLDRKITLGPLPRLFGRHGHDPT